MGESIQDNVCELSPKASSTSAFTGDFIPPSIDHTKMLSGDSFSYFSPRPLFLASSNSTTGNEPSQDDYLVLGVDEAGRGPVLGPMVYSAFYLPQQLHHSLLSRKYSFDDSKVLTPGVRMNLMRVLCTPGNPLFECCGWATKLLSARDISSGMMRPGAGSYNLNAQAMDATVEIIRGIIEERGMNVREVYIDTIGNPVTYQQKLEKLFPSLKITVAKKADSLYPCVSAASVVAKVTRDIALELSHKEVSRRCATEEPSLKATIQSWGSGYPSDSKCVGWLRNNMDPIFGWGPECRFSWGTAKEMLELKGGSKVDWPAEEDYSLLKDFLLTSAGANTKLYHELREWYGSRSTDIL